MMAASSLFRLRFNTKPLVARFINYKAPQRDIDFVLNEVFDYPKHCQKMGFKDVDKELIDGILAECAKVSANTTFSIYRHIPFLKLIFCD